MTVTSAPRQQQSTSSAAPGTRFWEAVWLVAGREITVRLRDKVFLFSTGFFLVIAFASTVLPYLMAGDESTVAVAAPQAVSRLEQAGLTVRTVADAHAAEQLVRDGEVDAAVVTDGGPSKVKVLAMNDAPSDVIEALSVSPPVQLLDPDAVHPALRVLVPLGFAMVFFLTSLTFGLQLAQSITEEKQTRIVEILVATVPVRALLTGKLAGNSVLALAQIVLVTVVVVVGLQLADVTLLSHLAPAIGWFIPFFCVGFLLLASMWAVAGALASRLEDVNTTSLPIQMVVMLPFFAVSFLGDNPTVLAVLSYVPFSAPTAMPLRLFFGSASLWEPVISLVLLLVTAVVCLLLGERLYRGSLLQTNGRTALAVAWRQAR